jgi:nucleotide-binding universal stress UspA family protein
VINEPTPQGFQPDGDMLSRAEKMNEHDRFMVELINKRNAQLENLADRFNKFLEVETKIEFGKFSDRLERFLEENQIDMIVMGTTGETSISEFFSGNHAARAIRVADIPVLAVKEYFAINKAGKLLLLVELKKYSKETVKLIRKFAQLFDLQVHIGHVKQNKDIVNEDLMKDLKKFAQTHDFKNYAMHVIGKGEKAEKIKDFAEYLKVDLIATISEGDSGLIRLLFGSDTEKFLNKVDEPILAISE